MGIAHPIPFGFGGRPDSQTALYANTTAAFDFAVAGQPFLSGISKETPARQQLAEVRKQQFDTSREPGEHSNAVWWIRAQSSFHGGTGRVFDAATEDQTYTEFADSAGVNPWTPGRLTLLRSATKVLSDLGFTIPVEGHLVHGYLTASGGDGFLSAHGTSLRHWEGSSTTITWGGGSRIKSLATDGSNYYALDGTGIYKGDIAAGSGSLIWDSSALSPGVVAWCKQRLMAGLSHSVYELVGTGTAMPTAKFSHPNTSWRWTSFADGPAAIYAAGFVRGNSAIYKFTLEANGAVPTLTSGTVATELPVGEVCYSIYYYLGFLAIGTSKGVRIGVVANDGSVSYGPLVIESTSPVKCFTGRSSYLYAGCTNGISGQSGLYRIDLGQENEPGFFAYATDLQSHITGEVASVSIYGASDRMVFGVTNSSGGGVFLEDSATLEATGVLTTFRIRHDTLDPKLYKYVKVRSDITNGGTIALAVQDRAGNETSLYTYGSSHDDDVLIGTPSSGQEYITLEFTLARNASDSTKGPVLQGWQTKSLSGLRKPMVYLVPLLCYDHEQDRRGKSIGYRRSAAERLNDLKVAAQAGDIVSFQDLGLDFSELVQIEELLFEQTVPPPAGCSGQGGIIVLTMRTII